MESLEALLEQIRQERGLDLSSYKPSFVERRLAVRMRSRGCAGYAAYARLLQREPAEYGPLLDALTINLTRFFRDPTTFQAIEDQVLPGLFEARAATRQLQIWSAGCAAGEEPYSLAIMLRERFAATLSRWQVEIVATDVDTKILEKARQGLYDAFSFQGLTPRYKAWVDLYCTPNSQQQHQLAGEVRAMVALRQHDLVRDPPPDGLDLILCRNVLIYFERQRQERLYRAFHQALRAGGFLVLGKTEVLPMAWSRYFVAADLREHIYRRVEAALPAADPALEKRRA